MRDLPASTWSIKSTSGEDSLLRVLARGPADRVRAETAAALSDGGSFACLSSAACTVRSACSCMLISSNVFGLIFELLFLSLVATAASPVRTAALTNGSCDS